MSELVRHTIHYFLHFGVPLIIALGWYRISWKQSYLLLLATMLIDLDHLLASPIFDPTRCSIGFHLFHSWYFILLYCGLLCFKRSRLVGIGLVLHIVTDALDCMCFIYL